MKEGAEELVTSLCEMLSHSLLKSTNVGKKKLIFSLKQCDNI